MSDVQAGWYPDLQGSARRRYWDGQAWTEHLEPLAPPAPPAPAPPAPAPVPDVAPDVVSAPPAGPPPPVTAHRTRKPWPAWARYLGLAALVFLVIVPILSPVAQHLVDTIGLNAEVRKKVFEEPDSLDTYQGLLRWSILVTFWAVLFGAIGLVLRAWWVRSLWNGQGAFHVRPLFLRAGT